MDRRWQARGRRRVRPAGAKPGAVVPTKFQIETAPKKSRDAKLLKLADKVSNLRSVALSPPSHWPDQRRREYVAWASAVAASLVGVSDWLDKKFEEAGELAVQSIPAAASDAS